MIFSVYKDDKDKLGVYCIKNTLDDRMYIGSASKGFETRRKIHLEELKKNRHWNIYLQNFVNKYGIDKLKFEILEIVEDFDKVIEREQFYLDKYWDMGLLFNIARIAGKGPDVTGRTHTEDAKKKMSLANKGKHHSEETKKKIRLGNSEKTISKETKEKMSLAHKGNSNSLGSRRTVETKIKISLANKGKSLSKETKEKMSLAKKGKHHSAEVKVKISLARKEYWLKRKNVVT